MFEADIYIKMGLEYCWSNPLTVSILLGILKWIAVRTETTEDDRILTMIRNFIKPKVLTVTNGDNNDEKAK